VKFRSSAGRRNEAVISTPTSKGQTNVVVEHDDFANSSRILKLEDRFLLDAQDDNVLPSDPNLATN